MAFAKGIGNLLKKATASNPTLHQAIRCMSSSKLFVGGISYGTDDHGLTEAFGNYGNVVEARVILDRETGRSRGFGFVTFTSVEEASAAITAMDGKELHGRVVRVNYATERAGGFRGGGGYGGGGGGYGGGGGSYGGGAGGYGGGGGFGGGYNAGGGGNYGVAGSGDNYGGSNFSSGGYGGNSGGYAASTGSNFGLGEGAGGSDNFVGTASGDSSFGANDSLGGFGGKGGQFGNSDKSGGQDDLLEDDFKDDDDEPEDFAKRG